MLKEKAHRVPMASFGHGQSAEGYINNLQEFILNRLSHFIMIKNY